MKFNLKFLSSLKCYPEDKLRRLMNLSKQILLGFSIIILLSVADSYTNYLLSLKVKENTEFFTKSESIIRNSSNLHKAIIEMQSAFRGFLLTHDTTFLELYGNGIRNIPVLFSMQNELIKNNEWQTAMLDTVNELHAQWLTYANSLIKAKKELAASESSRKVYTQLFESKLKNQVGKKLNDEITIKFTVFDKYEYKLRDTHGNKLNLSIKRTHTFSFIFLSLTIIVGLGSTTYIVMLISKRIASMVGLAENISKGEFSTMKDTHNDELTGLSHSLNTMSEKLNKNIQELEKRNTELDQFAYVVSHDLKAPIRGIHNVIKWIEEDLANELTPELKKYLNIIPQRTKRMEDLINGLLDYARTREKTLPEKIDTNAMLKDIVEAIVPRNFAVELNHLPVFYSERIKLEQVFINLISNSVKYTLNETGKIIVSCKELPGFYQFSVKDNGMGIDSEYHEKIFEIFQTLREKNEKESTGIGLAIVKKIINDQHGTIKVYSALGEGAEFVFTWPRNTN